MSPSRGRWNRTRPVRPAIGRFQAGGTSDAGAAFRPIEDPQSPAEGSTGQASPSEQRRWRSLLDRSPQPVTASMDRQWIRAGELTTRSAALLCGALLLIRIWHAQGSAHRAGFGPIELTPIHDWQLAPAGRPEEQRSFRERWLRPMHGSARPRPVAALRQRKGSREA